MERGEFSKPALPPPLLAWSWNFSPSGTYVPGFVDLGGTVKFLTKKKKTCGERRLGSQLAALVGLLHRPTGAPFFISRSLPATRTALWTASFPVEGWDVAGSYLSSLLLHLAAPGVRDSPTYSRPGKCKLTVLNYREPENREFFKSPSGVDSKMKR